ncbi:MAG: hypothetical protein OSA11_00185 [Candidatus Nanopelagicales bacterium]|nr:hypothetical protein [Candidatus Nanopelagicales bacterium]
MANPDLEIDLLSFTRLIINDYVLTDPQLRDSLTPRWHDSFWRVQLDVTL